MTRQPIRDRAVSIPLDRILDHKANVRHSVHEIDELAGSIREQGLLQPLLVTEHPTEPDRFVIVAGHRRAAACRKLGITTVPCTIRFNLADDETGQLLAMVVENWQRSQLGPVEKAEALGSLRDRGLTAPDIARATGLSQQTVHYHLRLLDLGGETREQVRTGAIAAADAHTAVIESRRAAREAAHKPERGRPPVVEPSHFNKTHPLAPRVAEQCQHSQRPKVGTVACGQCWEDAIRDDERTSA